MAFYSRVHALQPLRVARVAILRVDAPSSPVGKEAIHDLKSGLSTLGYIEGQNIEFEIRWAENKPDRLPSVSAELVKLHPDVIVTGGPQAVKSLKAASSTIPIVMGRMDDVVEHGLVSSLARPGGNVTGLSFQTGELSGKWLELLKDIQPQLSRGPFCGTRAVRQVSCEPSKQRRRGQLKTYRVQNKGT